MKSHKVCNDEPTSSKNSAPSREHCRRVFERTARNGHLFFLKMALFTAAYHQNGSGTTRLFVRQRVSCGTLSFAKDFNWSVALHCARIPLVLNYLFFRGFFSSVRHSQRKRLAIVSTPSEFFLSAREKGSNMFCFSQVSFRFASHRASYCTGLCPSSTDAPFRHKTVPRSLRAANFPPPVVHLFPAKVPSLCRSPHFQRPSMVSRVSSALDALLPLLLSHARLLTPE